MAIDEPIDAIQALNASDERQRSAITDLAGDFMRVVKMFAPKGAEIPLGIAAGVIDWASRQRAQHRDELLRVVAEELKYRGAQIERLVADSQEHCRFMNEEMPGLVLDVLRRAEQTRAAERIRRLGLILVRAAELGPQSSADYTEEMMRIAMDLGERDVAVLNAVYAAQAVLANTGVVQREQVNEAWRDHPPRVPGMAENEIQSTCAKLQSFGLVTRIERNDFKLGPSEIPHALLQKGKDFIGYLQTSR